MRDWNTDFKDGTPFEPYGIDCEDAPSLEAALKLAREKMKAGYDLFRGQAANKPLEPTARRAREDPALAEAQLKEFISWVQDQDALRALHGDPLKIVAVAQHFELRTPLLDMTTDPAVAAYFAVWRYKKAGPESTFAPSFIVCAKSRSLTESWAVPNNYAKLRGEGDQFKLLKVDIPEFRRIKAQSSVFVWTGYDSEALEAFSDIHRIYFPPTKGPTTLNTADVLPAGQTKQERLVANYVKKVKKEEAASRR